LKLPRETAFDQIAPPVRQFKPYLKPVKAIKPVMSVKPQPRRAKTLVF
jgi:hypothetical protein